MDSEEFKSAVITVLTAYKEDYSNNLLMRDGIKKYAVNRIEKTINNYKNGFITAHEALKMVIDLWTRKGK